MRFDTGPILILASLSGAGGVAASAMAAHAGGEHLGTIALFLMVHAPVLLIIGLIARCVAGAYILALGLLFFCGDLLVRDLTGERLFHLAAPSGGVLMILGWLCIGGLAILRR